jgi:hypothetical protein
LTGGGPGRSVVDRREGVTSAMSQQRFIHEFLNELESNEELSQQYDTDARAAMTTFGLSEEQQDILLNRSNQEIRDHLKQEMKTHVAYVIRMGSPK